MPGHSIAVGRLDTLLNCARLSVYPSPRPSASPAVRLPIGRLDTLLKCMCGAVDRSLLDTVLLAWALFYFMLFWPFLTLLSAPCRATHTPHLCCFSGVFGFALLRAHAYRVLIGACNLMQSDAVARFNSSGKMTFSRPPRGFRILTHITSLAVPHCVACIALLDTLC